jgi:hypothetical protein
MAFYLNFPLLQEPFDLGIDGLSRPRFVFNLIVEKTPSSTFLEELAAIVIAAGVGVASGSNRNIFLTQGVSIPPGDGPYLSIIDTGGPGGVKIQNQKAPAYQRPGAQVVARAKTSKAARDMAFAAYTAFANVVNQTVNAASIT